MGLDPKGERLNFWGTCHVWLVPKRTDDEPQKCRCPQGNKTAQKTSPDARKVDKPLEGNSQGEGEERRKETRTVTELPHIAKITSPLFIFFSRLLSIFS